MEARTTSQYQPPWNRSRPCHPSSPWCLADKENQLGCVSESTDAVGCHRESDLVIAIGEEIETIRNVGELSTTLSIKDLEN